MNPEQIECERQILDILRTVDKADALTIGRRVQPAIDKSTANRCLYNLEKQQKVTKVDNEGSHRPQWRLPLESTSVEELEKLCLEYSLDAPVYAHFDRTGGRYVYSCTVGEQRVVGKGEIAAERAKARAAHNMLLALSQQNERYSHRAAALYCEALHRSGRSFTFGETVGRMEGLQYEFKSTGDPNKIWPFEAFVSKFKSELGKIVCGFVNYYCLNPPEHCEILFGVHDTGLIQGNFFYYT
jgi:hypothetical protein